MAKPAPPPPSSTLTALGYTSCLAITLVRTSPELLPPFRPSQLFSAFWEFGGYGLVPGRLWFYEIYPPRDPVLREGKRRNPWLSVITYQYAGYAINSSTTLPFFTRTLKLAGSIMFWNFRWNMPETRYTPTSNIAPNTIDKSNIIQFPELLQLHYPGLHDTNAEEKEVEKKETSHNLS